MNASSISRALRLGGLRPLGSGSPRTREGLRVSQSRQEVRVVADLDSERQAQRLAQDAAEVLTEAGYSLRWSDDAAFYVEP